jgi:hypothetical protein
MDDSYDDLLKRFNALQKELTAWKERFPQYLYRPQDDCIALASTCLNTSSSVPAHDLR